MKILLSGADGFTGRVFTRLTRAAGHDVVPLHADLLNRSALEIETREAEPDAIVHLAAISFVGHADNSAFYSVNVVGTTNLLSALVAMPKRPTRVLLASSANVYGNCESSPITETQTPAPVNHYAMSKLAMEHMALTYKDRLNLIITRPFNYTGPGQSSNFIIPKLVEHFSRNAASISLGNLAVEREFNDVEMICHAYMSLLECGSPGEIYNVCSGKPYALQHVIAMLERLTGHTMLVEVNPEFVRANEVHRLCGSPAKLQALLSKHGANLQNPSLDETLTRMLAAARKV